MSGIDTDVVLEFLLFVVANVMARKLSGEAPTEKGHVPVARSID